MWYYVNLLTFVNKLISFINLACYCCCHDDSTAATPHRSGPCIYHLVSHSIADPLLARLFTSYTQSLSFVRVFNKMFEYLNHLFVKAKTLSFFLNLILIIILISPSAGKGTRLCVCKDDDSHITSVVRWNQWSSKTVKADIDIGKHNDPLLPEEQSSSRTNEPKIFLLNIDQ